MNKTVVNLSHHLALPRCASPQLVSSHENSRFSEHQPGVRGLSRQHEGDRPDLDPRVVVPSRMLRGRLLPRPSVPLRNRVGFGGHLEQG